MIFTVEIEVEYEGDQLLLASDSLQKCIDVVNNHKSWPYVGDSILFRVWEGDKEFSWSRVKCGWQKDAAKPFTFEEVMANMKVR